MFVVCPSKCSTTIIILHSLYWSLATLQIRKYLRHLIVVLLLKSAKSIICLHSGVAILAINSKKNHETFESKVEVYFVF